MEKKKKIKSPVVKGVAKVPVVMQLEALECGAASLSMVLAYYDKWIPLEKVRSDCGVSRDGSSAVNIIKAAKNYGLEAHGYRLEVNDIKSECIFPCIIHWNFNHFVVLKGFKGNKAYINDPAKGNVIVPMNVFDESFTGICLTFEPTEAFVPSGNKKSIATYVKKRLVGLRVPIIITVLTTVISSLLGLITPVFDKIFYDRLLAGTNPEWVNPFLFGLGLLYVVQVVIILVTTMSSNRINGKVYLVGNLSYMWKVLHLPMHFFSQRMTGDIAERQSGNATVADTLVTVLSPVFLNSIMMVFYFVVMIQYSWILTLVGILSTMFNLFFSTLLSKKRANLTRVQLRDAGKLSASTVGGIQMMETIKSSGAEEGYFEKWSGYFAAVNNASQKFAKENVLLSMAPQMVTTIVDNVILGIGIYLTIQGKFTLGAITAFSGFFASFMEPVNQLMNTQNTIQEMRTQMERIDDVIEYPSDANIHDVPAKEGEELNKLSGDVVLENVTFGYSPLAEPLIKDFSMHIKKGSRVAFVGSSGCGKSTLSKLISGLYSPWSGDILFDGKHIDEIDHGIFTGSLAVVDQDIILFEDTIANNIKMWDDSIEDFEMIMAAKDAQLHYDIMARQDGYQHKLTEGGKDLSGGQRQRLEIARVLAQEPNIIILDEATSALDAKTEFDVVKAIEDRGITCIVIAHRLSTIRDCDEIVVLNKGEVVERGTHEELMALGGAYQNLISNE